MIDGLVVMRGGGGRAVWSPLADVERGSVEGADFEALDAAAEDEESFALGLMSLKPARMAGPGRMVEETFGPALAKLEMGVAEGDGEGNASGVFPITRVRRGEDGGVWRLRFANS